MRRRAGRRHGESRLAVDARMPGPRSRENPAPIRGSGSSDSTRVYPEGRVTQRPHDRTRLAQRRSHRVLHAHAPAGLGRCHARVLGRSSRSRSETTRRASLLWPGAQVGVDGLRQLMVAEHRCRQWMGCRVTAAPVHFPARRRAVSTQRPREAPGDRICSCAPDPGAPRQRGCLARGASMHLTAAWACGRVRSARGRARPRVRVGRSDGCGQERFGRRRVQ